MHALGVMANLCATARLRGQGMLTSAMDMLELPSLFGLISLTGFSLPSRAQPLKANRTSSWTSRMALCRGLFLGASVKKAVELGLIAGLLHTLPAQRQGGNGQAVCPLRQASMSRSERISVLSALDFGFSVLCCINDGNIRLQNC